MELYLDTFRFEISIVQCPVGYFFLGHSVYGPTLNVVIKMVVCM